MAEIEEVNGSEDVEETQDKKQLKKRHNSGAADLERVTNFEEERELSNIANVNKNSSF